MKFEQRAIAFIDILGFKELVKRMSSDLELACKVYQVLQDILHQEKSIYDGFEQTVIKGSFEMTSFSDCVVISDLQHNFYDVVSSARWLYLKLLRLGILSRGAITIGSVCHEGRIVFGEGLVSAYTLESSAAVYPRIIVPDEFRMQLEQEDASHMHYKFADILKQDGDGLWFIQPFGSPWVAPAGVKDTGRWYFTQFRGHIEAGLMRFGDECNVPVLAKYRWLARRFNEAIKASDIKVPLLQLA